jgi:hypothetical protein
MCRLAFVLNLLNLFNLWLISSSPPCSLCPLWLKFVVFRRREFERLDFAPDTIYYGLRMNKETVEKYSCALTLSDMEVFVFPELMYALLLANIMSPVIWRWRETDTFKKLAKKPPAKRFMRLKQFIMDEYDFNLDLETWGLTSKSRELGRFSKYIDPANIARSNGLFGYTGDKYYFDVDIRKHFGLDAYDEDVIPYWKTETVEAMNSFRFRPGYKTSAGECVSLSSLYAAASYIVCAVPLQDIYGILTPLHSQNYLDLDSGIITNNRRVVTRPMWFNGTELSMKAQRALRNEQVTTVSHATGYVHCIYNDATIDPAAYRHLDKTLRSFLSAGLDMTMFANFLRAHTQYQKYVQFCKDCHGQAKFIKAEALYAYEHTSDYRIADHTHEFLLDEVSHDDYHNHPLPGRIRCDQLTEFMTRTHIDPRKPADREQLRNFFAKHIPDSGKMVDQLSEFVHLDPRLPGLEKNYIPSQPIEITTEMSRQDVIDYLESIRQTSPTADLAFYAYRDMTRCEWEPFIKAAIERSPVSIEKAKDKDISQVYDWLRLMPNESIYEGPRLAQPDEVANYGRGDGIEKAFTLANILAARSPDEEITIIIDGPIVLLRNRKEYKFESVKNLQKQLEIRNFVVSGSDNR